MQLNSKQLSTHLKQTLAPLYLISGDIPLLVLETREAITHAAKSQGFDEKEITHVDSEFDIASLESHLKNGSLFDTKKIIDIRNPSAKFDATWITVLTDYFNHPSSDRVILITTNKLTPAQQKSTWYELMKQHGVHIPLWPIAMDALPQWIIERGKKMQLSFSSDVAGLLATFSEGNLLAATQALEKLQLLHPNETISREQLMTVLNDHARFTIFDLSDALSTRNTKKVIRILKNLEQTGEEPPLVLWAICRKIRDDINIGKNTDALKNALQFAASVDQIIKGAKIGDTWQSLLQLCLIATGVEIGTIK